MDPNTIPPSGPNAPKLLDCLRERLQAHHVSAATVDQYVHWARQYILFHGIRHPRELTETEVRAFLDHLAQTQAVAVGTARLALVFLYREVLERPLREHLLAPADNGTPPKELSQPGPATSATPATPPRSARLLDQVRDLMRVRHYSLKTERCYARWITQYILFHGKRHPREMGPPEIEAFLTYLAVDQHVAASTQNQAFFALLRWDQAIRSVTASPRICSKTATTSARFRNYLDTKTWPRL